MRATEARRKIHSCTLSRLRPDILVLPADRFGGELPIKWCHVGSVWRVTFGTLEPPGGEGGRGIVQSNKWEPLEATKPGMCAARILAYSTVQAPGYILIAYICQGDVGVACME